MMVKYYEDFTIGVEEAVGSHAVDKQEIIDYAIKWDPQPIHIDEEKARKSDFKGLIAAGSHIFAISILIINNWEYKVKAIAMLGMDEVRFKHAVRPGDVLSLSHKCIYKRESENQKDRGIIKNRINLKNQNDEIVLTYIDIMLIAKSNRND
ncbi:MAG: MaoC/PaaZ C-terminal domain-containing protein [Pseudomonadota bacterium]